MHHRRLFVLAALAFPSMTVAQGPVQQSAENPLVSSFQVVAMRYGNYLATAFDSIPASNYSYKPTPVQQTIGYIAQHLEAANYGLCAGMTGQTRPMTAKDSLADTLKAKWPKDTLVARFRASLAYCDKALAGLTDAQLPEQISAGPGSGRMVPRGRWLLALTTDLSEHYAQLASYMRLIGLVPPTALPRPKA
jgi:uncharacterized damage-inducible protein DinB